MKKIAAGILIILAALLILNPNLNNFKTFAHDKYGDEIKQKMLDEPLSAVGMGLAHLFGELKICRQNRYVYSVFYVKISILGRTQMKPIAIGVGSFFIPLKDKEFVENIELTNCEDAVNFVEF